MRKNCHKILLEKNNWILHYVYTILFYIIQKKEKQEITCYAHAYPNLHVENPNGSLS